jgi:hypothetical protein
MKTKHLSVLFLLAVVAGIVIPSLSGCYYDVEATLYPGQGVCDPTDFAYSTRVKPIVELHCLPCHSQAQGSGGIVLEGYINTRNEAVTGQFLCSIKQSGCTPMPKGSNKLSDCDINAVQAWVDAGAPQN